MAYYGQQQQQYGQYPQQQGYGNQQQMNSHYQGFGNNVSSTTGSSTASATNAYNTSAGTGQKSTSTAYPTQGYNYGYSGNSTTTNSNSQPNLQNFQSLWYNHASMTSNTQTTTSQQQSSLNTSTNTQQQQQQRQQQMAAYQAQMAQQYMHYQQQQAAYMASYQQQMNSNASQNMYNKQNSGDKSMNKNDQQSNQQQASNTTSWNSAGNNQDSRMRNSGQTGSWGNQQNQGRDWTQASNNSQQQQQNGYPTNAGGDYTWGAQQPNQQQQGSIQGQPQMYQQQQRQQQNYQQNFQQGGGNNQRGNYQDGNQSGGNKWNQQNYQTGNNYSGENRGGQWNQQGGGNRDGGWGDWEGAKNRSQGEPHIPPFPEQWQMGGRQMNQGYDERNRGNKEWQQQGYDGGNKMMGNQGRYSRDGSSQGNRGSDFENRGNQQLPRPSRGDKGDRELWSPVDSKKYQGKNSKIKEGDLDKPIQATEIKSYLYAWFGVRRKRPVYDIHSVGERPEQTFRCELRINGYKFIGVGEAASKKESQTDAAWNFAEFLVKRGELTREELPAKTNVDESSDNEIGVVKDDSDGRNDYRSQQRRNRARGNIPSLMSLNVQPTGDFPNIPPPYMYNRRPNNNQPWGGNKRDWDGPWRGGQRRGPPGRGRWNGPQNDYWRRRDQEEQWLEEIHQSPEFANPEDIFINRMIMNQQEATMGGMEGRPGEWTSVPSKTRTSATLDDRHVTSKHAAIYPHEDELKAVHRMVTVAEKALKALSDQFVDEDHPLSADEEEDNAEENEEKTEKSAEKEEDKEKEEKEGEEGNKDEEEVDAEKEKAEKKAKIQILKRPKKKTKRVPDDRPRVLSAVNRVGRLAKGLLIHGDDLVTLVLLCGCIPTKSLLARILKHLPAKLKESDSEFNYELTENEGGFTITSDCKIPIKLSVIMATTAIRLSNLVVKKEEESDAGEEEPEDMIPKALLLGALARLRYAKWFQSKASQQDSCVVIIRILRDLKVREEVWQPLTDWALENLVYISLSSSTEHMGPGDAFRRFFEVVAGGILLPDRRGVQDPCEKEKVDVLDCCTEQQLEDITSFAQNCLLKIAFRQIHDILGMERLTLLSKYSSYGQQSSSSTPMSTEEEGGRKRRLEHNSSDSVVESPKRSLTDEEDTQQNMADLTLQDPNKDKKISSPNALSAFNITDLKETDLSEPIVTETNITGNEAKQDDTEVSDVKKDAINVGQEKKDANEETNSETKSENLVEEEKMES